MCGIVGLHLRDPALEPQLGVLLTAMLSELVDRGPDSAGVAIYGDPTWSPAGHATVTLLDNPGPAGDLAAQLTTALGVPVTATDLSPTTVVHAAVDYEHTVAAAESAVPAARVIGFGSELTVLKGIGRPTSAGHQVRPAGRAGWQGVGHTRMATESAVIAQGSHPFSVGPDQCLVHNGSFSNHLSIKHELEREGVVFDSENDTEVGARFIAKHLAEGAGLEKALLALKETFDGFYTLLVSTAESFAVLRDPIACKPAIIAETARWVAVASEYRALAGLPGIDGARIFEPEPEEVYVWHR